MSKKEQKEQKEQKKGKAPKEAKETAPKEAAPKEKKPKPAATPAAPLERVNIMPATSSDLDDDIPF